MSRGLPKAPSTREDFRIGIICALTLEAGMVEMALDKEWKEEGILYGSSPNDPTTYTPGLLASHNVVLAYCPTMGANAAAQVASSLMLSFTGIKIIFVVGICGAVPTYLNQGERQEVVLGDCMISTAVIQFDLGERGPAGFREADGLEALGRSSARIRGFMNKIQTPINRSKLTKNLRVHLQALQDAEPKRISYPGTQNDRLFRPTYIHTHCAPGGLCKMCEPKLGICRESCENLGCDDQYLENRERSRNDTFPEIHVGYFGASNGMLESGVERDELARTKNIIAFEMEGSGTWDVCSTVIIKAACDYADSHINKKWQTYAAAVAAAGLKAFLQELEFPDDRKPEGNTIYIQHDFDQTDRLSVEDNIFNIQFSLRGMPVAKKFIERPSEMRMLEQALLPRSELSQRKVFVLRGLGGIGKTQLAVQFMRTYHSKFSAVFWLDGSSENSLKQSMANLASKISPDQISDASRAYARDAKGDINAVVSEVLVWFAKALNNRWLLIFDNVDRDPNSSEPDPLAYDVMRFLPSADHGSVLITTRLIRLEELGESMEVKKVDQRTARNILESWYKKATYDEDEVGRLLEYLDGLPLAIAQASAYLQESGMNLKAYLQMYEEQREEVAELLHGSNISLRDYLGRSVWTTWIISYNAIFTRNKYVAHLLLLWSFLDNGDLWYGMFEEAIKRRTSIVQALSKWLGNITSERLSFVNAMGLLHSYSLIEGSGHSNGYSMHSVVHRWTYFYQGLRHQSDIGMLALTLIGGAVPMYNERDCARLQQRLLSHAQVCCVRTLNEQAGINKSTDHNNLSALITDQGQKEDILEAIHNLGALYYDQSKLDEAENLYNRALQGKEEALGTKHISTLKTANNLGAIYFDQSKLDKSENMYMRALQGKEEVLGAKHALTLATVGNLGLLYKEQGKRLEAEKMFMRALQGLEEALGVKHAITLDAVWNLGLLYKDQGKLLEAEKMYMRALQGKEEVLGAKHISTLDTVASLGSLYKDQGKLDEAEKMLLRALQGFEKTLEAKHKSKLETFNHLGALYSDQGTIFKDHSKLLEAEKMLLRALQGCKEKFGDELVKTHVLALSVMRNLGKLYSETRPDESQVMYTKALSGYTKVRGASSDICLDLQRRLDALDISSRRNTTNPGLGVNSTEDDDKPPGREGKFKKRKFEK